MEEEELRNRMEEKLKEIFGYINTWLHFAEAKNGAMLVLTSGFLYVVVSSEMNLIYKTWEYRVLISLVTISMCFSLYSFYPKVDTLEDAKLGKKLLKSLDKINQFILEKKRKVLKIDKEEKDIRFFYTYISKKNSKEYIEDIYEEYYGEKITPSKMELEYAEELIINSKITLRKYKRFKKSVFFFGGFIVFFIYLNIFKVNSNLCKEKKIQKGIVVQQGLIMREAPTIKSKELEILDKLDEVEVLNSIDDWVQIKYEEKIGWGYKIYITFDSK